MKGKKFLSLLLAGLMVVSGLTACGGSDQGEATKDVAKSEDSSGENVTIRILACGTDYPDAIDKAVKEN